MAIAPLIIRITALGAAALARTAAAMRALGRAISGAARSGATGAFSRLTAVLRALGSAALRAAVIIGGALRRALRAAQSAASDLTRTLLRFMLRWGGIIAAVTAIAAPILNVFANLIPLVTLLGPAVLTAAAAMGALVIGMKGVGDALSAGLEGDTEAYTKALKKLAPAAQETVKALVAIAPAWRQMAKAVQQKLFAGVAQSLKSLVGSGFLKGLESVLGAAATAINGFIRKVMGFFESLEGRTQLGKIFTGIGEALPNLLDAIGSIGRAFLTMTEGATPQFVSLSESIKKAADKFQAWMENLKNSGKLDEWIQKAKDTFGQLKDIVQEVGRVFGAIFKGTDEKGFLENLKNSIKELADWLESENGQAVIGFFSDVAKGAANLIVTISEVVDWIQEGRRKISEFGEELKNKLGAAFGAIGAAASAMFGIIAGGAGAFSWIGGVLGRLGQLVGGVQGAVRSINAALNSIRTNVVIDIITRRSEVQGYARAIGGGSGGGGRVTARAAGGPVQRGFPYVVGDRGGGIPELFVPTQSGRIMSSVPAMAGGSVSVGISVPTNANNKLVAEIVRAIRVDVRKTARGDSRRYWESSGRG